METDKTQKTKKTIFDLNEDWLTEILKYLDFEELREVKNAHNFFHDAINRVVAKRKYTIYIYSYEGCSQQLQEYRRDLKAFGDQLQHLSIVFPAHVPLEEQLVAEMVHVNCEMLIEVFCSNGNIKHCSISGIDLTSDYIKDNPKFFETLWSLDMDMRHKDPDDCFKIIPHLNQAKRFKVEIGCIKNDGGINKFLRKINHNQLEVLQLLGFKNEIKFEALPINTTLTHLEAPNNAFDPSLLLKHFPNLEFLEIGQSGLNHSLEPLLNFSKLKHLSLVFGVKDYDYIFPLVKEFANRNQLETIKLNDNFGDQIKYADVDKNLLKLEIDLANNLKKMTQLRSLSLNTVFSFKNRLIDIANSLTYLAQFEFGYTMVQPGIFKVLLPKIVRLVAVSNELEQLTLDFRLEGAALKNVHAKLEQIRRDKRSEKVLNLMVKDSPQAFSDEAVLDQKYVNVSHKRRNENCCNM